MTTAREHDLERLVRRRRDLHFSRVPGTDRWVGVDAAGVVHVSLRRPGGPVPDATVVAQDAIETGSQVVGEDDEYA